MAWHFRPRRVDETRCLSNVISLVWVPSPRRSAAVVTTRNALLTALPLFRLQPDGFTNRTPSHPPRHLPQRARTDYPIRTFINTWETLEPHNQAAAPA